MAEAKFALPCSPSRLRTTTTTLSHHDVLLLLISTTSIQSLKKVMTSISLLQQLRQGAHLHFPGSTPSSIDSACAPVFPPSFWDNLSKVPFCWSAVRELNRRNREQELGQEKIIVSQDSNLRRSHRLRARGAAANKTNSSRHQCVEEILNFATSLEEVRRLSRHGGPDLTDLRGVHDVTYVAHHGPR